MGDRWHGEGPPDEAYSRCTRDLAEVTAGFRAYVDALPALLVAGYDCVARTPTKREVERLATFSRPSYDDIFAVEPAAGSSLVVARATFQGGTHVDVLIGRAWSDMLPTCFCDACDEDATTWSRTSKSTPTRSSAASRSNAGSSVAL